MKRYYAHTHRTLRFILNSFSKKERIVFFILLCVAGVGILGTLATISKRITYEIPIHGGSYTEAIVGTPRFINPLLALSEADRTIVNLVYSGLLRKNSNGEFIPDLAENMDISDDGMAYTLTLRDGAVFQDGTPVTSDDVIFSVAQAQNNDLKSPLRVKWQGVTAQKIDDKTIQFILTQPYSGFSETLTMGILPKHLWEKMNTEEFMFSKQNIDPIGSGPYRITKISKDKEGVPTSYTLHAFKKFTLGNPYISRITIISTQNEEEAVKLYKKGKVDAISAFTPSPETLDTISKKKDLLMRTSLPRIFGIFLNRTKNAALVDPEVVKALDMAINKDKIITEVLNGYGTAIDGPLPPALSQKNRQAWNESMKKMAESILDKRGWVKNSNGLREKMIDGKKIPLAFTLATGNATDLQITAELVRQDLEKIGVTVSVQPFETGNLEQDIIRTRNYEALLFGQIIEHEGDLYAFWHSSQKSDPGLNLSLYSNQMADKLLSDIISNPNPEKRKEETKTVSELIQKDRPAIFLYAPDALYALPQDLRGISFEGITKPSDHFLGVYSWYRQTDRVLKIFAPHP